jgi:hypothetical protein
MPLALRNFTWNSLRKWYEEENKSSTDDNMATSIKNIKSAGTQAPKVQVPSYVTKASKK